MFKSRTTHSKRTETPFPQRNDEIPWLSNIGLVLNVMSLECKTAQHKHHQALLDHLNAKIGNT